MKHKLLIVILLAVTQTVTQAQTADVDLLHEWNRTVCDVIMEDGFGPPVAARHTAYINIAAYETMRFAFSGYQTLAGQLNGLKPLPTPNMSFYDWRVAVNAAYKTVSSKTLYRTFMTDSVAMKQLTELKKTVAPAVFDSSVAFGTRVGKEILVWAVADNYKRTQGKSRYEWPTGPGKWEPTPPNFAEPLLPYMQEVRTLVLTKPRQFPPARPTAFSTDPKSDCFKAFREVYDIFQSLTPEQKKTADFWNDNPAITTYSGHLIFNTRTKAPGSHWIWITSSAAKQLKKNPIETQQAFTAVSIGLMDAFIACWAEKYTSNTIRPVTFIKKHIDSEFEPYLQTPPFPEHTSGHSTITACSATILARLWGEHSFEDDTEVRFGHDIRKFNSFAEAAQEASISRVYGGIHVRRGCDEGNKNGVVIGNYIFNTLKFTEPVSTTTTKKKK